MGFREPDERAGDLRKLDALTGRNASFAGFD
jgi:hypothetical protein